MVYVSNKKRKIKKIKEQQKFLKLGLLADVPQEEVSINGVVGISAFSSSKSKPIITERIIPLKERKRIGLRNMQNNLKKPKSKKINILDFY